MKAPCKCVVNDTEGIGTAVKLETVLSAAARYKLPRLSFVVRRANVVLQTQSIISISILKLHKNHDSDINLNHS